jgi:hypothetical protein
MSTVPTFSIYLPNTDKDVPETLKHCWLERKIMNSNSLPAIIVAGDGNAYTTVYDSRLPQDGDFEAIISFQNHTYGKFAIIRVAKEGTLSRR